MYEWHEYITTHVFQYSEENSRKDIFSKNNNNNNNTPQKNRHRKITVEEYFQYLGEIHLSNLPHLSKPILAIHAYDDPLIPKEVFYKGRHAFMRSTKGQMIVTKRGG